MDQNNNSIELDNDQYHGALKQRYAALIQREPGLSRLLKSSFHSAAAPAFPGASAPPEDIRSAQAMLEAMGYPTGGRNHRHRWDGASAMDGICGPATDVALRKFQRDHGIDVTGEFDADTMTSLKLANTERIHSLMDLERVPSPPHEPRPAVLMKAGEQLQREGLAPEIQPDNLAVALGDGGFVPPKTAVMVESRIEPANSRFHLSHQSTKSGYGRA